MEQVLALVAMVVVAAAIGVALWEQAQVGRDMLAVPEMAQMLPEQGVVQEQSVVQFHLGFLVSVA
jgi:uncharacterized protein HemY